MEYEYSYKVDSLDKYIEYLDNNYKFIEKYKETRVIYRNNGNMARITTRNNNYYLDFKENKLGSDDLIVRKESKTIKFDNLDNCESILEFLNYKKDNSLSRYRTIYEGNNIKFEIDEYIEPEKSFVVSFEGDKDICDRVAEEIKALT